MRTPISRLPLYIHAMLVQKTNYRIYIATKAFGLEFEDSDEWKDYYRRAKLELGADVAEMIARHGRCHFCGAEVSPTLTRCACGSPKNKGLSVVVDFPIEFTDELNEMVRKDSKRARELRLRRNGGSHTQEELAELLVVQEGRCYYCCVEFEVSNGKPQYHRDHYTSLLHDGSDDIFNLVLACPTCNRDKKEEHGDRYKDKALKRIDAEAKKKLVAIRKAVRAYRSMKRKELSPAKGC